MSKEDAVGVVYEVYEWNGDHSVWRLVEAGHWDLDWI